AHASVAQNSHVSWYVRPQRGSCVKRREWGVAGPQVSVAVADCDQGVSPLGATSGGGHSTVRSAGGKTCGGVVSTTFRTCEADVELLQRSRAVHVRVSVYALGQGPGARVSAKVTAGLGSQLSVAVRDAGAGA